MKIHVQPAAADDLLRFLRRADCRAELIEEGVVEVDVPASLDDEQARMEVDLYVKAWKAANPEADIAAHLLDPRTSVEGDAAEAD